MNTAQLLREILSSRVYEVARVTPLDPAPLLSRLLDNEVLLKREDLQPVFSFKIRGAHNRIASLDPEVRARGVIAASAGNHAQGVAYSARHLGARAIIVMPESTPAIKVDAVRDLGPEVLLVGASYPEAEARAREMVAESGFTMIHPFDDPLVIAGQGTIADEILRRGGGTIDAIFVPVGGGGLIAGIAAYVKEVAPQVKVIGVEPFEADAMYRSLEAGHRVRLDQVGLFAEGVAVREVGEHTFEIAKDRIDEMVRVTNDEICAAIKDVFQDTRSVMEPSGALSVAGVRRWVADHGATGQRLVAILSGANMNFDRLRFIAERADLGEAREAILAVTIPEKPGSFQTFCRMLGNRVITEFNYRLSSRSEAHIFVGISIESKADGEAAAAMLREAGYETVELTGDEMAKLHVRHMVGGRAPETVHDEVPIRFDFPERPGALMKFLDTLGGRWNISMFHYRNHGADFGRVLAGLEVSPEDREEFQGFLDKLGYRYELVEPDNAAYRLFLA